MEEREFARYAFLIVAVVAVVGLLTSGGGLTGFATKVGLKSPTIGCDKAKQMVAAYCKDNPTTKKCKDAEKLAANVCKTKPAPQPAPRPAPAQQQAPPQPAPEAQAAPAAEAQAARPAPRWDPTACEDNDQVQDPAVAGNLTYVNATTGELRIVNDHCDYNQGVGKARVIQYECDLYGPQPIRESYISCDPQSCGNFTWNDPRSNNAACPPAN